MHYAWFVFLIIANKSSCFLLLSIAGNEIWDRSTSIKRNNRCLLVFEFEITLLDVIIVILQEKKRSLLHLLRTLVVVSILCV